MPSGSVPVRAAATRAVQLNRVKFLQQSKAASDCGEALAHEIFRNGSLHYI